MIADVLKRIFGPLHSEEMCTWHGKIVPVAEREAELRGIRIGFECGWVAAMERAKAELIKADLLAQAKILGEIKNI